MPNRLHVLYMLTAFLVVTGANPFTAGAAESLQTRFQRAAHVLQRINPGVLWPSVVIARRIATDDTTNSLLKHPDTHYVLVTLARELTDVTGRRGIPYEAAFYLAQAQDMLGNHQLAAQAMSQYLQTAPYRSDDFLFLVRNLYATGQYKAARESSRRWRLRDGKCNESRLDYVWGSYCAEKQFEEAAEAVKTDPCQGWHSQILLAKLRLEAGEAEAAEAQVNAQLRKNPKKSRDISLFWNKLSTAEAYP